MTHAPPARPGSRRVGTPELAWKAYVHYQNPQQSFRFTGQALERRLPTIACDSNTHLPALGATFTTSILLKFYKPRSGQIDLFVVISSPTLDAESG
jgi:hypothetical protein